jgi:hypothetical protein
MVSCRFSVPGGLLLHLLLSLFLFVASENEVTVSAKDIQENVDLAKTYGLAIPYLNLALLKHEEAKIYQTSYNTFFRDAPKCVSQPSELLSSFSLTIEKEDLNEFLKEDFVQELPREIQSRLKLLKYNSHDQTMTDTYSKMSNGDDKTPNEFLEIGHFLLKSTSQGSLLHILLLGPSLKTTVGKGCTFTDRFREQFIGKSQHIQNLLAIKAAGSRGFVNALAAFSEASPDILKSYGFEEIKTRVGVLLGTSIEIPLSEGAGGGGAGGRATRDSDL